MGGSICLVSLHSIIWCLDMKLNIRCISVSTQSIMDIGTVLDSMYTVYKCKVLWVLHLSHPRGYSSFDS